MPGKKQACRLKRFKTPQMLRPKPKHPRPPSRLPSKSKPSCSKLSSQGIHMSNIQAPVRMYTSAVCPFCVRAERLLNERGVQNI
ncbi:MAG: hypothetical protein DCE89_16035, partial [Betaproteobacteria bacterium]